MNAGQQERLALLLEELGEAQQCIGKILRHGFAATNPASSHPDTNRDRLERELGDVMFAIELLAVEGDITETNVDEAIESKANRVWKYMYWNEPTRYFERWPSRRVK